MSDGATAVNGVREFPYFADGEWRTAENHRLFDVYRPYDRSLYARVAAGGRAEATQAVDAAAKAFPAWSQTTPAERARLFFEAAEIVICKAQVVERDTQIAAAVGMGQLKRDSLLITSYGLLVSS